MQRDYYAVLGVVPSAEDIVIRAAYKALAQRYHPDRWQGDAETAHERMAEINEAYRILSDPNSRAKYDKSLDQGGLAGETAFRGDASDPPPEYDPLDLDWEIAQKYYPDLESIDRRLSRISWRLAYAYRARMLETKMWEMRERIANEIETGFLACYFSTNPDVVAFGRLLIQEGNRKGALMLNQAVRVLGRHSNADRIIEQVTNDISAIPAQEQGDTLRYYGITQRDGKWQYAEHRYDRLQDALAYARRTHGKKKLD